MFYVSHFGHDNGGRDYSSDIAESRRKATQQAALEWLDGCNETLPPESEIYLRQEVIIATIKRAGDFRNFRIDGDKVIIDFDDSVESTGKYSVRIRYRYIAKSAFHGGDGAYGTVCEKIIGVNADDVDFPEWDAAASSTDIHIWYGNAVYAITKAAQDKCHFNFENVETIDTATQYPDFDNMAKSELLNGIFAEAGLPSPAEIVATYKATAEKERAARVAAIQQEAAEREAARARAANPITLKGDTAIITNPAGKTVELAIADIKGWCKANTKYGTLQFTSEIYNFSQWLGEQAGDDEFIAIRWFWQSWGRVKRMFSGGYDAGDTRNLNERAVDAIITKLKLGITLAKNTEKAKSGK